MTFNQYFLLDLVFFFWNYYMGKRAEKDENLIITSFRLTYFLKLSFLEFKCFLCYMSYASDDSGFLYITKKKVLHFYRIKSLLRLKHKTIIISHF